MFSNLNFNIKPNLAALLFSSAFALSALPTSAAILQVDGNGNLTGALDVDVGGVLYDVAFQDGSFNNLYNGTLFFTDEQTALLASQSLMNTVFIDGPQGNFDSNPILTAGCTENTDCFVYTPWQIVNSADVQQAVALNRPNENDDSAFTLFFGGPLYTALNDDTANESLGTYAVWSNASSVAAIPEPSTYAMFLAGLGLLGFAARRKHA